MNGADRNVFVQKLPPVTGPDVFRWFMAVREFGRMSLASTIEQSYEDMSEFLIGFAHGFSKKPKTLQLSAIGNTSCFVYLTMAIHWRTIDQFKHVPELHKFLVHVLGEQKAGSLKRIEKLCQRVGWSKGKRQKIK